MSLNFFSLPSEIRNEIYGLLFLHQEPIWPWRDLYDRRQKFTPGLFLANKTVHREAAPLFYARNCFDFKMHNCNDVASFLQQIGGNNAGYIRGIRVDFPGLRSRGGEDFNLKHSSVRLLATIQSHCANLVTITTSRHSLYNLHLELANLDGPKIVTEALKRIDNSFRTIRSLQEIVVEVHLDDSNSHTRREMKRLGWTFSAPECEKESSSDESSDDMHYYYGGL
jgi:hypothetical protein